MMAHDESRSNRLYVNCDNVVQVDELTNEITGNYMNSATCTFDVLDSDGVSVLSGTGGVTMDYVAASNGKYQGILQSTESLTEGEIYTIVVDVSQGGIVDQRRWTALACYRTEEDDD
jgi:hypothetical protein